MEDLRTDLMDQLNGNISYLVNLKKENDDVEVLYHSFKKDVRVAVETFITEIMVEYYTDLDTYDVIYGALETVYLNSEYDKETYKKMVRTIFSDLTVLNTLVETMYDYIESPL